LFASCPRFDSQKKYDQCTCFYAWSGRPVQKKKKECKKEYTNTAEEKCKKERNENP